MTILNSIYAELYDTYVLLFYTAIITIVITLFFVLLSYLFFMLQKDNEEYNSLTDLQKIERQLSAQTFFMAWDLFSRRRF